MGTVPARSIEGTEGQETVLFVDDESALRKIAEEALTDRGYRELTAEDGASTLALFDLIEIDVDIVTTDQIW